MVFVFVCKYAELYVCLKKCVYVVCGMRYARVWLLLFVEERLGMKGKEGEYLWCLEWGVGALFLPNC